MEEKLQVEKVRNSKRKFERNFEERFKFNDVRVLTFLREIGEFSQISMEIVIENSKCEA